MSYNDSIVTMCNDKAAHAQVYGIIFVSVQILCGFSANAIFLFTYFHMKITCRYGTIVYYELLLYLCVLDIATCSVIMPVDVLQQRYTFTLLSGVGCKVQHYTRCVLTTASVGMTLVIAVHRYRKISAPLGRHMSFRAARCVFGAVMAGSMVLHVPVIVVTGQETFHKYNVSSLEICGIDDGRKDSPEVKALFFVWICVFCLLTLVTVALYGAIGIHIHAKETRDLNSPTLMTSPIFFPTSTAQNRITELDKNALLDDRVQLRSIPSMRSRMVISGGILKVIGVGENANKVSQTNNQQLQPNSPNMLEAKALTKSETATQDYKQPSAVLSKSHTLRPRSQELLSTLRIDPSCTRRTQSFGNINDLKTMTKLTLRTKQQQQRKQRHDDILRVGMLISMTYFLSVVPFSVALPMVLSRERFGDEALDIFVHLGVRSLYVRSALNPLLYGLFDGKLRRLYVRVYKQLKEKLC